MGNGVSDLRWLDGETAAGLEPSLRCSAALLSPSTGIIDSHALMLALLGDAEDKGAVLALRSPVQGGDADGDGISLRVGGKHPMTLQASIVVNAAGLSAQAVAESIAGLEKKHIPPLYLAKGDYFVMSGHPPFSRLIYPLPGPASLGIHFSLDMGGRGSFGPDVEWVGEANYSVHPSRARSFYAAIRSYYPDLAEGALRPSFAGVRPKLQGPGEAMKDFVIQSPRDHGVSGLINLFGIESPGLTSSLALADYVVSLLEEA
jgi:L-2-hydroxyglutarate oxidase LhgO